MNLEIFWIQNFSTQDLLQWNKVMNKITKDKTINKMRKTA